MVSQNVENRRKRVRYSSKRIDLLFKSLLLLDRTSHTHNLKN